MMTRTTLLRTLLLALSGTALAAPVLIWSTPDTARVGDPTAVDWTRGVFYGVQRYEPIRPGAEALQVISPPRLVRFDLNTGRTMNSYALPGQTPEFAPGDSRFPVALSPDGTTLAVGYAPRVPPHGVQLLEAASGRVILELATERRARWVVFHPTRPEVLVGADRSCPVRVFSRRTGQPLTPCRLQGKVNDVWELGFTSSGQLWVLGSHRNPVVFSYPALESVRVVKTQHIVWGGLSFSPDGTLVTGCFDNLNNFTDPSLAKAATQNGAQVYEVATGRLKYELPGKVYMCARFDPNGRTLISRSVNGVSLWDAKTGKRLERVTELGDDCLEAWNKSRSSVDFSSGTGGNFAPRLDPTGTRALDGYRSCDARARELRLVRLK